MGWSVLQHEQQAALVPAELGIQRMQCGDDPTQISAGHKVDRDIQDRLGLQSGDGRGADMLDGDHQLPEGGLQLAASRWNAPGQLGSLGASRTCP